MVTIYDVARVAGVSPATVSRVFNGITVTPARKEAVTRAAADLGFVPNQNARRLRTSSSKIIAMLVPDIENPFFTALTRAVEDIARADGYSVMLCNTDEDPVREQEYLRVAVGDPVAGVLMVPSSQTTDLSIAIARGVPVVCVDRHPPDGQVDAVVVDNLGASIGAVLQLFAGGFRRVACITGPERVETARVRAEGWRQATIQATGAEPDPQLFRQADFTIAGGERNTRALLDLADPPDAIMATNNKLAAGALRVLAERHLLPPDFGLMAFGGLPLMILEPAGILTTLLPARELGLQGASMLLERIRGSDLPPREVVLPVTYNMDGTSLTSPLAPEFPSESGTRTL